MAGDDQRDDQGDDGRDEGPGGGRREVDLGKWLSGAQARTGRSRWAPYVSGVAAAAWLAVGLLGLATGTQPVFALLALGLGALSAARAREAWRDREAGTATSAASGERRRGGPPRR